MTKRNGKQYLLTTAVMVLLTSLSCIGSGVLQLVMGMFISVLLAVQTTRFHYGYLGASVSLLFLIPFFYAVFFGENTLAQSALFAAVLMLPIILMGLSLGFACNLKLSFFMTVILLSAWYLLGNLSSAKVLETINGPAYSPEGILSQSAAHLQAMLEAAYADSPDTAQSLQGLLGIVMSKMVTLLPSVFVLMSLLTGFVTTLLFRHYQAKHGMDMSFWPTFSELHADRFFTIPFLVLLALYMVADEGLFSDMALNVICIMSGIFFVLGLSYLDFKLHIRGTKTVTRRILLIVLVPLCMTLFSLPFLLVVSFGVLDGIINFRKQALKK